MKNFLRAIQFLTIIPVKPLCLADEKKMPLAAAYFPLAGLAIGLLLVGLHRVLLAAAAPALALNILPVAALVIITGGIHLDGLSDSADAFLSGKTKEEMLSIMRDPHAGAMGSIAVTVALLLKIALLSMVSLPLRETALILMCVLGRWAAVLTMCAFPYARKEGKASVFLNGLSPRRLAFSTSLALASAVILWHLNGVLVFLVAGAFAYLVGLKVRARIGGITGDTIGATVELTEIAVLCAVSLA